YIIRTRWDPSRYFSELLKVLSCTQEESTRTVMAGLRSVVEKQGWFSSIYSDPGEPLLPDTEGRTARRYASGDGNRQGNAGFRYSDVSGLLAASSWKKRTP